MANLQEIRTRIRSVKSTQQTTRAMKMVSAAKLRRAQDRMLNLRPYAQKQNELLQHLLGGVDLETINSPYLRWPEPKRVLYVVVSSNRGLCGAFNAAIAKETYRHMQENYPAHLREGRISVMGVGKKGYEWFQRNGFDMVNGNHDVFADLTADNVNKLAANPALEGFLNGEWDRVELSYNQFKNVAAQIRTVERLLPLDLNVGADGQDHASEQDHASAAIDYIFEPGKDEILIDLIPQILRTKVLRAVLESNASEHGARMVAMDNATENAEELLRELRLTYNKARQASITNEILEIVSGANALGG